MPDRRSAAELLLRLTRRGLAWSGVLFSAAMFSAASPAAAEPSCPASTTLTPGSQNSPATAVLYCGGTYTDTWNAEGETDWIAFYTTQASATVVAHYEAVDTSGDEEHAVRATLFDPGSATEGPDELPPAGPVSAGNLEPLRPDDAVLQPQGGRNRLPAFAEWRMVADAASTGSVSAIQQRE
jgi:hypothetical protein